MPNNFTLPTPEWILEDVADTPQSAQSTISTQEIEEVIDVIQDVLAEKGLGGSVTNTTFGPQVTLYELGLPPGTSLNALAQLAEPLALKLNRHGAIRMLLPIPGRTRAGIEVANSQREFFSAGTLFQTPGWARAQGSLSLLLGRDGNQLYTLDLSKGNHLLVAGHDGAGKSNLLQQFLLSILARRTPEDLRLLMYEPKGETFKAFAGIPHLLAPVAKDAEAGIAMLDWCVQETKRRRKTLMQTAHRTISEYNAANEKKLPEVIFFIDEIAQLLDIRHQEQVHELLYGLDSAGNVGIHLIVATATLPDETLLGTFTFRICGRCPQASLSAALLGVTGAEALLGSGDLLMKLGDSVTRCQSGLTQFKTCQWLAGSWIGQQAAKYDSALQKTIQEARDSQKAQVASVAKQEPMLNFTEPTANDAMRAVLAAKRANPSVVSAALGVSCERAGNLLDELAFHEYLSAPDEHGERVICLDKIPPEFLGKGVETRKTLESLLNELARKVAEGDPKSRTVAEYNKGVHAIGKKIVEEAAEVWMAAEYEGPENTSLEISQLFYHLLVLMLKKGLSLEDIYKQL